MILSIDSLYPQHMSTYNEHNPLNRDISLYNDYAQTKYNKERVHIIIGESGVWPMEYLNIPPPLYVINDTNIVYIGESYVA